MKTLRHRGAGLLTTSLLLAGVSALSPASVRAAGNDTCSFGGNMDFANCSGFAFTKQGDKQLTLFSSPTVGAGTVQFSEQTPGVWVVDVDFIQELMAVSTGGTFEYEIEIVGAPNTYFDQVGLALIGPPIGDPMFNATKTVSGPTGVNPPMLSVDEINRSSFDSFAGLVKKIRVVDTYEVTVGSVNSIQNSYSQKDADPTDTVPGPLPLLGAGAAFGFSRRLRTRVLAARGA
jgi:hypothetical protein